MKTESLAYEEAEKLVEGDQMSRFYNAAIRNDVSYMLYDDSGDYTLRLLTHIKESDGRKRSEILEEFELSNNLDKISEAILT
jgi:hypothetical protein